MNLVISGLSTTILNQIANYIYGKHMDYINT